MNGTVVTDSDETAVAQTINQVLDLPWVEQVRTTDRDDATHTVLTNIGVVRRLHEVLELQNLGVSVEAFAPRPHGEMKVYVTIRE